MSACANRDIPVGWLCSLLTAFGRKDIGLGGFAGYETLPDGAVQPLYVGGGHSAALDGRQRPDGTTLLGGVASYVISGVAPNIHLATSSWFYAFVSRLLARALAIIAAVVLFAIATLTSGVLSWVLIVAAIALLVYAIAGAA